jgi:cytochrome c oxidase cbb3-type subunit III
MWNIPPGGEELVAPKKSSAEGLNMFKENPFLSNLHASSAKTKALRLTDVILCGLLAISTFCPARSTAQEKKEPNATGSEPARAGAIDESLRSIYPNLPPDQDSAAVARGKDLYGANCAFCHGKEATGGNSGPDLLRSVLVNHDEKGELIGPVIRQGRASKGMPGFDLGDSQISDLVAFLHQRNHDARLRFTYKVSSVAIGDPLAGKAYFESHCAACHAANHDLVGIASKYQGDELQQRWLDPGGQSADVIVTITLSIAQKYTGKLKHLDEFSVSLYDSQGNYRSFALNSKAKVEIQDPLDGHRKLLEQLSDTDMHNVTTFLETLK